MKLISTLWKTTALALGLCLTGCISVDLSSMFSRELEEVTLQEAKRSFAKDKIAVVDISGFISNTEGGWGADRCTPDKIKGVLQKIEDDDRVKAVILRIDSPGGGVTATDLIYHEIQRFKERTQMPVIAVCMGVAASGGYYIANAADRIYALPTTITGSIGVIASFPRLQGLAGKIGYDQVVVKSGKMKDIGNPFRDMTEEEQEVFQAMIDGMYSKFLAAVLEGRTNYQTEDKLRPIADGRIYTADQALDLNLVDAVGYLDDAIQAAKKAAKLLDAKVITYSSRHTDDPTIYSSTQALRPEFKLIDAHLPGLPRTDGPGFYYLWMPGQ